jgi:hypothetical protein
LTRKVQFGTLFHGKSPFGCFLFGNKSITENVQDLPPYFKHKVWTGLDPGSRAFRALTALDSGFRRNDGKFKFEPMGWGMGQPRIFTQPDGTTNLNIFGKFLKTFNA